jgi:hypothetical protein
MGDRAIVVFEHSYIYGGNEETFYSPGIYLHWNGGEVEGLLNAASSRLRKGDPSYASARFTQICGEMIPGNLSLGLVAPPEPDEETGRINWNAYSPGDNGVFIVNCSTGKVINEEGKYCFTIVMGGDS